MLEEEKFQRTKENLRGKKLLKLIPPNSTSPKDAILLFGHYKDEKISFLLAGYDTAPYVINYLAQNKMIPRKTRKIVQKLIENYDPFGAIDGSAPIKMEVEEISIDEMGDIPW